MTWRPIAEAPQDGRICVVHDASGDYDWRTASFTSPEELAAGYRAGWWDDGFWIEPQPTYFFVIPRLILVEARPVP